MCAEAVPEDYDNFVLVDDASTNPFSDDHSVDDDSEFESLAKTISFPDTIDVPIIDSLLPMNHSTRSSITSVDDDTDQKPPFAAPKAIEWTNADLYYLLSILYPEHAINNHLIFTPPLESLQESPCPLKLQLHIHVPVQHVPPEAYSADLPIGTGRPISRTLLAESARGCRSPVQARKSLANALLADRATVKGVVARYNALMALYSRSSDTLTGVKRGMLGMAQASETEWSARLSQFQGIVDDTWEFEPRLEAFLLEAGIWELDGWMAFVELALELEEEEREVWAGVYGEAGRFLEKAISE